MAESRAIASPANQCAIPAELLRRVNVARPLCAMFQAGRCRKARKCPRLHDTSDSAMNCSLPYTSRYTTKTGRDVITLRPPLALAAKQYFAEIGKPCVLGQGRQWNTASGKRMITYSIEGMASPDMSACEAASSAGFARTNPLSREQNTLRYQSNKKKPDFHGHATSLKCAISILGDGAIRPSPGIAGQGVYSHECKSDHDPTCLDEAWQRGASGRYNECALFVFKTRGIMIASQSNTGCVPPGATAWKTDQFSSHPSTIEYMSFTTTVDGWLGELSTQLDDLGYTQTLHKALMDVKFHMEEKSVPDGYDVFF